MKQEKTVICKKRKGSYGDDASVLGTVKIRKDTSDELFG